MDMQFLFGGIMAEFVSRQELKVTGRELLTVNEVLAVLAFDEDYVKLSTEQGVMIAEGKNMVIENLSKERGEIIVRGRIDRIEYLAEKKKK